MLSRVERLISKCCHTVFHSLGPILPQSSLLCLEAGAFDMVDLNLELGSFVWETDFSKASTGLDGIRAGQN